MKIKIGDTVKLKSGHPIATGDAVVTELDTDGLYATLLWTSEDGSRWNSASPVDDLDLVKSA